MKPYRFEDHSEKLLNVGILPRHELKEYLYETDQEIINKISKAHSWSNCLSSSFKVRTGPNYRAHGKKKPSGDALYEVCAVDIYRSNKKMPHFGRFVNIDELERKYLENLQKCVKENIESDKNTEIDNHCEGENNVKSKNNKNPISQTSSSASSFSPVDESDISDTLNISKFQISERILSTPTSLEEEQISSSKRLNISKYATSLSSRSAPTSICHDKKPNSGTPSLNKIPP